ncbi:MAG: non-homologous end-joining DNA ligase [Acidimicrobiales bacterium]
MLATAGPLPPDQGRYTFEFKWDGIRAVVHWDGTNLRLETRNLRDVTVAYPELQGMVAALGPRPAVLDGEIVALDGHGAPSFQRLQERMHVGDRRLAADRAARVPACWFAFDVLHLGDNSTMALPWTERRARLESLVLSGPSWATPPSFAGEGDAILAAARARGLEGVVAKRLDSVYVPGARSSAWIKVKLVARDEFVVGGWLPGEGGREGSVGSLLLGVPDANGALVFVGAVGTGFTDVELRRLSHELAGDVRPASPFTGSLGRKGAVFVEPRLVVDVEYRERTSTGILRHPSYKGTRIDKSPADLEPTVAAAVDKPVAGVDTVG